jgi:hypothetical protein
VIVTNLNAALSLPNLYTVDVKWCAFFKRLRPPKATTVVDQIVNLMLA